MPARRSLASWKGPLMRVLSKFSRSAVWRAAFICLLLALVLPVGRLARPASADGPAAPPQFAQPEFQQTWARTDGPVARGQASRSWLWGPEPGAVVSEP